MDDDIFSDPKKKQENNEDSNMDWKKSGFDKHERMTLKINAQEAEMYNANKERKNKTQVKARTPLDVPKGFKRIRKKIRDSYDDEDEDDDEYILVPVFMDKEVSSLERALTPQEKKQLEQMEKTLPEDINVRQSVERDIRLQQAEKTLRKEGIKPNRKITEQKRNQTSEIKARDLAEDNLKKRKKQKEKKLPIEEKDKSTKPANELPKIKNAEEKEVRQAIIDDAEKDKQSVKKNIEKQQDEKNEINPVTKENTEKEKILEKDVFTNEQLGEQKPAQELPQPESQPKDGEKTARQIILEKSGRAPLQTADEEQEKDKNKQKQEQILIQKEARER